MTTQIPYPIEFTVVHLRDGDRSVEIFPPVFGESMTYCEWAKNCPKEGLEDISCE